MERQVNTFRSVPKKYYISIESVLTVYITYEAAGTPSGFLKIDRDWSFRLSHSQEPSPVPSLVPFLGLKTFTGSFWGSFQG